MCNIYIYILYLMYIIFNYIYIYMCTIIFVYKYNITLLIIYIYNFICYILFSIYVYLYHNMTQIHMVLWVQILLNRLEANMLNMFFFDPLGIWSRFFKGILNLSSVLNSQFQISDCINRWSWEDKNILSHPTTEGTPEANPGRPKFPEKKLEKHRKAPAKENTRKRPEN